MRNREKRKKSIGLRQWLRYYWVAMLCSSLFIFSISQYYITKSLADNTEKELDSIIQVSGKNIDKSLEVADSFIYETFIDSNDIDTIIQGTENIELSRAKDAILQSIKSVCGWSDALEGMVFYAPTSPDQTMMEVGTKANFKVRQSLKKFLQENMEENIQSNTLNSYGYMTLQSDGVAYIIRIIKIQDCYFASCISEKVILDSLESLEKGMDSIIFIADEEGNVISSSESITGKLDVQKEGNYININNSKYLLTTYISEMSKFKFGVLTGKSTIMEKVRNFQIAFIIIFLMLMLFFPISVIFEKFFLEKPLSKIVVAMHRIGKGEWNVMINNPSPIKEYNELTESFNHMVGEIEELKILNYESELKYQKANLKYLQLQIKPHFYVNALNIIYSLAQIRDYKKIQEMSGALVEYSRYMFHDATTLVYLSKELKHVENYIEIQRIRYSNQIIYEEKIDQIAESALVPPFIVQSFMENSIKYAYQNRENMILQVEAEVDEQMEMLVLKIRDNGDGYSEEILESFNNSSLKENSYHLGLNNVMERLKLIYGDSATIELKNDHGAVSIIRIPFIPSEE